MRKLVIQAQAADEEIDRIGAVYRAEDVHAWLARLAKGDAAAHPKPWQR